MRMLAGRWTVEFLRELNFDLAFVSAAGVTLDAGLTTSPVRSARSQRARSRTEEQRAPAA
jgi:DeoR/GlpR family transcriptional regulator of sugar metabolism